MKHQENLKTSTAMAEAAGKEEATPGALKEKEESEGTSAKGFCLRARLKCLYVSETRLGVLVIWGVINNIHPVIYCQ